MSVDKIKGQIKEAAGKATGDKELETEGKTDQVVADVKDAVSEATETVAGVAKSIKDTVTKAVKK
jgi:uncharacterized protein YjbJ (UPF0337 family)